ncbi:MAG: transporter substrate-binding domain-containing protein [Kiritimatiellae bacterium]|nr:transporter substrate-binding domain-containing protein [Kiritimatiellia bacterium]
MRREFLISVVVAIGGILCATETVRVADCERDAKMDYWASADVEYCRMVMEDVFREAGIEPQRVSFDSNGFFSVSNAEVICSAFRTPTLLRDYDFPVQPLGRMHFALYATPERAKSMRSVKITDWPRMRVGYSPVSQGYDLDRERYFEHANLSPDFVEFPTSTGAVKALRANEIDLLFLYTPYGKRPDGLDEIVPIGVRNVYFAVRKDKPELMRKLSHFYRECYINHIARYDGWRESLLGISKPAKRVRVAAYARGDFFEVSPDGDHSGAFEAWMKTICAYTHWSLDFVYGGYDESLVDVQNNRLDLIGGLGFSPLRGEYYLFPHTPIGMLRVYLWTRPDSHYKPGDPASWNGMRVGMLSGTISSQRAKLQFDQLSSDITYREYSSDRAMLKAYFDGEVDACLDLEMPELANETALHLYASHPMYICTSTRRKDLFEELEKALDEVCDDFPKYMRMISEHHYGLRSQMSALSLREAEWLKRRLKENQPVLVDFSPWPFRIRDEKGRVTGLAKSLLSEISRQTGLTLQPQPQTGIQTAEAKFLRGETSLWIPYPESAKAATYGAVSVFSLPVPQTFARFFGAKDEYQEMEMFAGPKTPPELITILRKAVAGIDPSLLQEMFMNVAAERKVVHRVFGLTSRELGYVATGIGFVLLLGISIYGAVMMKLLRREAKRANEAAQIAEQHAQAKTRFLAMMSHELRTPLNAVIGFAEFLKKDANGEMQRSEYINGILLSANALLELINDILDLSKLDAGAMQMRVGTCDMNQLMRELPAIFGYRVRDHKVALDIDQGKTPIPVLRLAQQGVRQILINLVGNAAKFTESGKISVKSAWFPETETLHISVSDTGCGISREKMEKLFDPFVQDIAIRMKNSKGEINGTGLGLPIVKRMVEAAGGTIQVESELGKGTKFTIDIPGLEVTGEKTAILPNPDQESVGKIPNRVLVVDDMTMNRKILDIHLSKLGVSEVENAENGIAALRVMENWIPDLVLTDMWMPEMDGSQLVQAMRSDSRLSAIPIVAVTADVDVGSTYDMKLFADVISKPVTGSKLLAVMEKL